MSSIPVPSIPPRRTARTTRAGSVKDTENATARPGRTAASRVKPPSNSSTSTATGRATGTTAASRAKAAPPNAIKKENGDAAAAHKRKREVASKDAGKGKETFDGVVLKKTTTTVTKETKTTVDAPRVALKTLRGPSSRNGQVAVKREVREVLAKVKEEELELDMHIDAPAAGSSKQVLREPEELRAIKKRRTSSEIGEEELRELVGEEALDAIDEEEEALEAMKEEEHPANARWDDLDAEDADDPQMVSEYVVEIFEYMKEVEQTTMPNPDYMANQDELSWKMRGIMNDWLIQLHFRFRLLPETLFLTINLLDRFLSARQVSLAKLQLAGLACLFVACKVEEIASPSASQLLKSAEENYTETEMLKAEQYVLKSVNWNISYPNPMHFLRRISKADGYDVHTRTIAKYLLEISCVEWRLLPTPPSLLAAAAVWLARLIRASDDWTANLEHYSSYSESDLLPTANIMLNYLCRKPLHDSFYKKYASRRYMKASVFVHHWALQMFGEGARPDLEAALPELRAMHAQMRVQDEEEQARAVVEEAQALERNARLYQ